MADNNKKLNEVNRVFNIAENPLMNYISDFLGESASVIFKDAVPDFVEPLIMLPIHEYKEGVHFMFELKTIHPGDDSSTRVDAIDNVVEFDRIKEGVGFLFYCIKTVYASLLGSDSMDGHAMDNVNFKIDEKTWEFYPYYRHDLTIKKQFYEETLHKLLQNKAAYKKDDPQKYKNMLSKYIGDIQKINLEITPDILKLEAQLNEKYKSQPKLGIFMKELMEHEIPRPPNPSPKLSSVSSTRYE